MPSLLAIDWDQRHLHLVAVQTHRRGVRVEWAADWDMGDDLTVRTAEAIGKRLRDYLKADGITAGAALVAVGRERVILKDVRFPQVSASEEPALVRFQATKDVTDSPDSLEVDYSVRPAPSGFDRQATAVLSRKDQLSAIRTLCKNAGLKLLGVAPRPFGASAVLERCLQAGGGALPADSVVGVLTVGQRWAELCLVRGHELLLARSLPAGSVLVGEVKRSLAVFAAQNAADPRLAGPTVLYVFGNGQSPAAALAEALPCGVEPLSPLTIADGIAPTAEDQASLAGAVGLAQRWAALGKLPINLAAPKRMQAAGSPTRRRGLLYGAAAALVLIAAIGVMYWTLGKRTAQITELTRAGKKLDEQLKSLEQERADIDAVKEWDQGSIPMLDELYDLAARFPFEKGIRVNQFTVEVLGPKPQGQQPKGAKDPKEPKEQPVARVRITGINQSNQDHQIFALRDTINRDPHLKATIDGPKSIGQGREFTIRVDVMKQDAAKFQTVLVVPPAALEAAQQREAMEQKAAAPRVVPGAEEDN